jgi:hypothetical protein
MSLTDVGLRKKFRDMFRREPQYTLSDFQSKSEKCEELFEVLRECVKSHGWNDNQCAVGIKPKYDRCIIKRVSIVKQTLT